MVGTHDEIGTNIKMDKVLVILISSKCKRDLDKVLGINAEFVTLTIRAKEAISLSQSICEMGTNMEHLKGD